MLIERIPKDKIPDLVLVINEVEKNVHGFLTPSTDFQLRILKYLFEVYNQYNAYADEPQDIGCSGCRSMVIGKFRQFANTWKIQQQTLSK